MENICEARIAKKGHFIQFGNKKGRCFLEFRCDKPATETGLCANCSNKNPNCRTQDTRTFEHGRVWEPLPEKSQIYGGPWYYKNIEINGKPTADDLEKAIKHQQTARKGFPQIEYMPPKKEKPIKKVKSADDLSQMSIDMTASTISEISSSSKSTKSRESTKKTTSRTKKPSVTSQTQIPITIPEQLTLYPIYVEVNEEPVEICEIETITISEFEHDDDLYYKSNEDQRVFMYLPNGNIGGCVGVYKNNTIIELDELESEELEENSD